MSFLSGVSSFFQGIENGINEIKQAIGGCLQGLPIGLGAGLITTGVLLAIPGVDIGAAGVLAGILVSAVVGCVAGGYFSLTLRSTTYQSGTQTPQIVLADEALFNEVLNAVNQAADVIESVYNYIQAISKGFEFDVARIVARDLDNPYQLQADLNEYIQDNVTAYQNALNTIYNNFKATAQIYTAFLSTIGPGILQYDSKTVGLGTLEQLSVQPGVAYLVYNGQNGTYKIPIGFAINVSNLELNVGGSPSYASFVLIIGFVDLNVVQQFQYIYVDIFTSSGIQTQQLATNQLNSGNAGTNTNDLLYMVVSSNYVYGVLPPMLWISAGCGTFPGVQQSPDIIYPGGSHGSIWYVIPVNSPSSTTPIVDLTPIVLITEVYDGLLSSVNTYAQALYELYTQLGLTPQQALASLGLLNVSLLQPLCTVSAEMYNDIMLQLSIAWNTLSSLSKNIPNVPTVVFPVYGQWLKVPSAVINGQSYSQPMYLAFDRPQVVIPAGQPYTYKGSVMIYNPSDGSGTILVNPTIELPGSGYYVWRADLWFYNGKCHRVPVTVFQSLLPPGSGFILSVYSVIQLTGKNIEPGWSISSQGTAPNQNPEKIVIDEGSNVVYYLPYNVAYAVYTPQGLATIQATTSKGPSIPSSLILLALLGAVGVAGGIYLEREYKVSQKVEQAGRAVYSGAKKAYRTGVRAYRSFRAGYKAFRETLRQGGE